MRVLLWVSVWLRRLVVAVLLLALVVAAPILWVETACRGAARAPDYAAVLPEEHRRDESRTYTTYPEWHIVHAYDDYARIVAAGDPHEFGYLRAIAGFWTSLCPLAERAAAHGGFTAESKQTIYTIGASFTAEMLLKAAYEETIGRLATLVRGDVRAPLDEVSAAQAAGYAAFLQQTPWYRWDFAGDAAALAAANSGTPRDRERAVALNIEYRAKALYAGVIARAVAAVGEDEPTIRSVVSGLAPDALAAIPGVEVIGPLGEGIEIETPRYRAFTVILQAIAAAGGDFVEIAGNDDILFTAIGPEAPPPGAVASFRRQGAGDWRHLIDAKVWGLASRLRGLEAGGLTLEHVHDY